MRNVIESRKKNVKKPDDFENEESEMIKHVDSPATSENEKSSDDNPLSFSAYVTLVCFFFQVAGLIHVDTEILGRKATTAAETTTASTEDNENSFLKTLFDLFNFRCAVSGSVCPTDDLTFPVKEFINVCMKFSSMFNLLFFYIGWKCVEICRTPRHQDETPELHLNSTDSKVVDLKQRRSEQRMLSFASISKIGFMKLIKLNFTSISLFAFHMVHCVAIDGNLHLYLYGDLRCYVWWQYIILFGVLPVIVLYPLAFGMSLDLLKESFISPAMFLFAQTMPFYTGVLVLQKKRGDLQKCSHSDEDKICIEEILKLEEEFYKEGDNTFQWSVVQLYRNLLIAVLNIFISDPIYRSISFIPMFLVFCIRDCKRSPFKHDYLNSLQVLSSACLLVITACNIPSSFSIATDLLAIPGMREVLTGLKYTELFVLALVPCSLLLWKILEKRQSTHKEKELKV